MKIPNFYYLYDDYLINFPHKLRKKCKAIIRETIIMTKIYENTETKTQKYKIDNKIYLKIIFKIKKKSAL